MCLDRRHVATSLLFAALALVLACGGSDNPAAPAGPPPVASVVVTASTVVLTAGDSVKLSVETRDASGVVLTGRAVTFASSDTTVARVSGSGEVRAVRAGSATITATSEGKTGSVAITVQAPAPVAAVQMRLASHRVLTGVTTESARAIATAANGDTLTGRAASWHSSDTTVARIDSTGRITALSSGSTELLVTIEGKTARDTLVVEPRSKYTLSRDQTWSYVNGSEPDMPVWDAGRQGFVPQSGDTRPQIVLDQTFSVPAGTTVTWDHKIVWIRPTQAGNINIAGSLVIRNSLVLWDQTQHQETRFVVASGGRLEIDDSYAFSSNAYWVNWDFKDGSTVAFDHYQGSPWTSLIGQVAYSATNGSTVWMTLLSGTKNSSVSVSDAQSLYFELFPSPGTYQITFPAKQTWTDWSVPALWPQTTVSVTNSYLMERDLSIDNNTHVTVTDTPSGFNLGWAIHKDDAGYADCSLGNLGNPDDDSGVMYSDTTWAVSCNNTSLRVVNSRLLRAWPVAFGNVHLKVTASNLVDPENSGNGATYEIYNSTIDHLRASNGGKVYVESSRIRYDVQVSGSGSIVYVYGVTSRDATPFQQILVAGGQFVTLSSPGVPW